jgi:hypothetical protein
MEIGAGEIDRLVVYKSGIRTIQHEQALATQSALTTPNPGSELRGQASFNESIHVPAATVLQGVLWNAGLSKHCPGGDERAAADNINIRV